MKKKITVFTLVLSMMLALCACKPSDEKLSEAETARGVLLEAKESAEATYLDITDSSKKSELEELSKEVAEIEALDFTKMSDKKIDGVLPKITELTQEYQSLNSEFDETLAAETKKKAEKDKYSNVGAYLVNKTGMNLTEVVLHDLSEDTYTDNLLGDGVVLEAGYTLMGVVLDINKSSADWEFIVKNDNNTSYTLACDSLAGADEAGISITLKYSDSDKTGSASLGSYTVLKEPETAENGDDATNASSEATN